MPECPRTPEFVNAPTTGGWTPELAGHAETCPACRDAALTARMLRRLADTNQAFDGPPPSAGTILLKARLAGRLQQANEQERRALAPLRAITAAAVALGVLLLAAHGIGQARGAVTPWSLALPPLLLLGGVMLTLRAWADQR